MKKNYIYLKLDNKSMFFKYINNINLKKYFLFGSKNIIYRFLRKKGIINYIIFGFWKFNIKKYKYVILGENGYSTAISKYIKKKNPNCKIILYYWNIINEQYKKILDDKNIDEFWTFDKKESEKYNIKYNPQFYTKDIILKEQNITYDILFLGRAKGRKQELLELEKEFNNRGLITKINIIEKEKDIISYERYLKLLSTSRCILDYNQKGQVGLTLRPMEALFFRKKLITNNKDIKNYIFYNPNNIFIIGVDDNNKLNEFIRKPFQNVDDEIIDYYDYNTWLKRFGI